MPQHREYEPRRREERAAHSGERRAGRAQRNRRPSTGRTASFVVLYVAGVIGASILLACIG